MSELCGAEPSSLDVRFRLPDVTIGVDTPLVSVESDDDVRSMMEEFDLGQKIPIFLFTANAQNTDDEIAADEGAAFGAAAFGAATAVETVREMEIVTAEEPLNSQIYPSTSASSLKRGYVRHQKVGPGMSGETFRRDSQSLVVGQEYEDVQAFRNVLTSAAIAANFELHMIRSDQRRVTARCAAEDCTWRVHASKLPQVTTFRIRTLTPEHTCVRTEEAGHRQATAKWIANCIKDKLRHNWNYKPREIVNDIHQEYGVLITYKRAFLGREKALEELRAQPEKDVIADDDGYECNVDSHDEDIHAWGEIDDPPRKKQDYGQCRSKEVRPLHCTQCNQIGHNRRTCGTLEASKH
uniref:Transposase MuDR plant domain-containing protein n=1 Tax=Ananas comosus var. bracteatus TaxID=296719 RepID=A0A6V7QE85_ANACO|nr:unnamed protein product [Ananas comosus var. bracteatus]